MKARIGAIVALSVLVGRGHVFAQAPPWTYEEARRLASASDVVIVGEIAIPYLAVIDPARENPKAKEDARGNRIWAYPDPNEFLLGSITTVQVLEVLKGASKVSVGQTVEILLAWDSNPFVVDHTGAFILFLQRPAQVPGTNDRIRTVKDLENMVVVDTKSWDEDIIANPSRWFGLTFLATDLPSWMPEPEGGNAVMEAIREAVR